MHFVKMQGLGNDFVVVRDTAAPWERLAPEVCDRRRGVGADGVLVLGTDPPSMRLWNADGSEAEMCGNGVRCAAVWASAAGLGDDLTWRTAAGPVHTRLLAEGLVEVDMGTPRFDPAAIPTAGGPDLTVRVGERPVPVHAVGMGNPHAVVLLDDLGGDGDLDAAPLGLLAAAVRSSGCFPAGANVELVAPDTRSGVRQRTDERGVGETDACGTGACATVAALRRRGLVDDVVTVTLRGGPLEVCWNGEGSVLMRGPATAVFEGSVALRRG